MWGSSSPHSLRRLRQVRPPTLYATVVPTTIYELHPLKGVPPIQFGMSASQVRAAFTEVPTVFRKTLDSGEIYAYQHHALQVFFDAAQTVEFIEFSRSEHLHILYAGIDLLGTLAGQVIEQLSQLVPYDQNAPEQGYSYTFPTLELALWRPVLPQRRGGNEGRYFRTVGIGRAGYYSTGASPSL